MLNLLCPNILDYYQFLNNIWYKIHRQPEKERERERERYIYIYATRVSSSSVSSGIEN